MATIDYKEKYEAALERCKKLYNEAKANEYTSDIEDYETIFPELKESEDSFYMVMTPNKREKLIAWLEKQGEDNMGISEATKKKLEDNLNKALEKETPESWNKFLEKQGEQKFVWSEEDEKKRKGLIKGLEDRMGFGWASDPFSREEYIDWLKSLRPQNTWKPSDEQMNNK